MRNGDRVDRAADILGNRGSIDIDERTTPPDAPLI